MKNSKWITKKKAHLRLELCVNLYVEEYQHGFFWSVYGLGGSGGGSSDCGYAATMADAKRAAERATKRLDAERKKAVKP